MSIASTSGVHMYDEIDDDDFKSDFSSDNQRFNRMSVLTVDNTYVTLPKSASPTDQNATSSSGEYNNVAPSRFKFDTTKPCDATMNEHGGTGSGDRLLQVPKNPRMSVDSTGYMLPSSERGKKKKYIKK